MSSRSHLLFLGTYTRSGPSRGIYAIRLDGATGALGEPTLAAAATDPAWVELSPDRRFLYAIQAGPAQALAFAVDPVSATLTPLPVLPSAPPPAAPGAAPLPAPSHLAVDRTGRVLLAANYHAGFVAALPIRPDGTLGHPFSIPHSGRGPHPTRQEKPHVHSVTVSPDNRHVLVADLGLDRVFTYALDVAGATLTAATPPSAATAPAAGPRHGKFSADGRFFYVLNELDATVAAFRYDLASGALSPLQTVPTLPPGFAGTNICAEVRLHPNGRVLYASNRGHDSIAVFALDPATGLLSAAPLEIVPTGGVHPRNFALSPDGRWLVCGHQNTPLLTVFAVDPASGRLTRTPHQAAVPACVCVAFYD